MPTIRRIIASVTFLFLSTSMLFAQTSHDIQDVFQKVPTQTFIQQGAPVITATPSPQVPPPSPVFNSGTSQLESAASNSADAMEFATSAPEFSESPMPMTVVSQAGCDACEAPVAVASGNHCHQNGHCHCCGHPVKNCVCGILSKVARGIKALKHKIGAHHCKGHHHCKSSWAGCDRVEQCVDCSECASCEEEPAPEPEWEVVYEPSCSAPEPEPVQVCYVPCEPEAEEEEEDCHHDCCLLDELAHGVKCLFHKAGRKIHHIGEKLHNCKHKHGCGHGCQSSCPQPYRVMIIDSAPVESAPIETPSCGCAAKSLSRLR